MLLMAVFQHVRSNLDALQQTWPWSSFLARIVPARFQVLHGCGVLRDVAPSFQHCASAAGVREGLVHIWSARLWNAWTCAGLAIPGVRRLHTRKMLCSEAWQVGPANGSLIGAHQGLGEYAEGVPSEGARKAP